MRRFINRLWECLTPSRMAAVRNSVGNEEILNLCVSWGEILSLWKQRDGNGSPITSGKFYKLLKDGGQWRHLGVSLEKLGVHLS